MRNIPTKQNLQYFYKMNISMNKMLKAFLENDNLCNLMFYDKVDALDLPHLSTEQKDELVNKRFLVTPHVDFNDVVSSFLIIGIDEFALNATNPEFINQTYTIKVYCHKDLWLLGSGKIRPFLILDEIHQTLCGSRDHGIGRLQFKSGGISVLDSGMTGYIVKYDNIDFKYGN